MSDQLYVLRALPLFKGLTDREIEKVFALMEDSPLPSGALLFKEGSQSTTMYVVWLGEVEIFIHCNDGGEQVLARLDTGDCLGEMGLVRNATRSASARATKESLLMMLRKERLDGLYQSDPKVYGRIMSNIAIILADRVENISAEVKRLGRREAPEHVDRGFFARLLGH